MAEAGVASAPWIGRGPSSRGMTVRDIQAHLLEIYEVEVSPDLISRITDAALKEVNDSQAARSTACIR